MHTFSETAAGVPAFLAKLWRLVEDPETNNLICWSKDGRSFIIQNQAQFARELLPLNYKHNNMASFIRQLNMYGFHKITSIDNGGLKFDRDEMEFTHPCFKRNCPYLLEHIKRKIATTKSIDEKTALKPEAVTKVLQDVKAMRGRQDSLDSRFSVMKQENEALWREIASLRQKHAKQQQIVNKLIQFLITIVQPQRNMTSVKRHMQLMINDIPDKKMRKTSESKTESGPVIHELEEELLDEVSVDDSELMVPNSPFRSPQNVEQPPSNDGIVSPNFDFSNQSAEDSCEPSNVDASSTSAINYGLIQTVNNDGSKIFYHITEVPDAQPQEANIDPVSYNEDNVLTTPMVREEMARNKLLKQKNRQRRVKVASSSNNIMQSVAEKEKTPTKEQNEIPQQAPQIIQIKSEHDSSVDPTIFLNVYQNKNDSADPKIVATNFSDDSLQSYSNTADNYFLDSTTLSSNTASPTQNCFLANNSSDLYNPNNFITTDIPADIFEDNSTTIIDENNSKIGQNNNFKEEKRQIALANVNCDKSSTYSAGSTTENGSLQPSTSAAAAIAMSNNSNNVNRNNHQKTVGISSSTSTLKDDNFGTMALTKYTNNQEITQLSTIDDVSGHLGIVQDELECLKDLLRSDAYCLDNNTLLGMSLNEINFTQNPKLKTFKKKNNEILSPTTEEDILNKLFNDADILGPYSLHLTNDESGSNDKKGSELTAYQPIYDLSDIINDQNELDADANIPTTSTSHTHEQQEQEFNTSVLNTPYHE